MSTIEVIEVESLEDREVDWIPVGHMSALEWLLSDRTTRPTKALCGVEILGIPADTEHVKCEDCTNIIEAMGIKPW